MSNKMWDVLVEHAKTCVLSGKLYIYYAEDSRTVGVVFNNIYELIGLISGDQYLSADSLSDSQKVITFSLNFGTYLFYADWVFFVLENSDYGIFVIVMFDSIFHFCYMYASIEIMVFDSERYMWMDW